jgi:hypothetical protein
MCSRLPLTPVLIMCSPGVHEARASPSTESQATIRSHLVIGNVCLFLGTGATQGPRGRNCMAKRPRSPPGEPMTLGNMRANGVRSLAVSFWQCHHQAVLSVDRLPDHMPVPAFGPRMCARNAGLSEPTRGRIGGSARGGVLRRGCLNLLSCPPSKARTIDRPKEF